jgi:hypothetical protein
MVQWLLDPIVPQVTSYLIFLYSDLSFFSYLLFEFSKYWFQRSAMKKKKKKKNALSELHKYETAVIYFIRICLDTGFSLWRGKITFSKCVYLASVFL